MLKIAATTGDPSPNSRWPLATGGSASRPRIVTFTYCCSFRRVRF